MAQAHLDTDNLARGRTVHVLRLIVVAVIGLALFGLVLLWPRGDAPSLYGDASTISFVDATVREARDSTCPGIEAGTCQAL